MSKDRAFKVFMRLASDVINGLAELGADFTFEMTSDCGKAVSKFIMLLYAKRKDDKAYVQKMNGVGDLRWRLDIRSTRKRQEISPQLPAL